MQERDCNILYSINVSLCMPSVVNLFSKVWDLKEQFYRSMRRWFYSLKGRREGETELAEGKLLGMHHLQRAMLISKALLLGLVLRPIVSSCVFINVQNIL